LSLDANFRLCRRGKAGSVRTEDAPILKGTYFLCQREVDKYVASKQKLESFNMPVNVLVLFYFKMIIELID